MVEYRDGLHYLTHQIVDTPLVVEERSYRELLGDPINIGLDETPFAQFTKKDFIEAGIGVWE